MGSRIGYIPPPPSYRGLGVEICLCRQKRPESPDHRLLFLEKLRSPMQRRFSFLRHAAPRQPSPVHFIPSAACNPRQRSEQGNFSLCDVQYKNERSGIVLKGFWTVRELVAGDATPRFGHYNNPESVCADLGDQGAEGYAQAFSFRRVCSPQPSSPLANTGVE